MRTNPEPRLEVLMSWWGMTGLGQDNGGAEWSMEEKVRRIAEAGFDGIHGGLPDDEEAADWNRLLEQYGLSYSTTAHLSSAGELDEYLHKANLFGKIDFVNVQVLKPFLTGEPAVQMLGEMAEVSRKAGIPTFIETHRGTITQDLLRTAEYVQSLAKLELTIDFSHYVVAGEMVGVSDEAELLLQELLTRTRSIHARVSNGEQIQVGIPSDVSIAEIETESNADEPMLKHFLRWWLCGMSNWRQAAQAGDVLPFVCELGPPLYAITVRGEVGVKRELSDRWTQSLLFARLARELWAKVNNDKLLHLAEK
ncbi:sugar phosphate isomerase/epimerase [Paenibacillus pasadenensis]|uniref:sugar phosphate isomerase/epimerase family protein n=1 Tax=Paenibacillus pasadenensis TaxID=217090 RepID=UPI00203E495E|nr:sugar phosphate isomerase/epimerase [Paenibacillus pasadenensis]MCM3747210.1 sugar phosphate isomerase/epimerase [Paenibacillus pasadenensis]